MTRRSSQAGCWLHGSYEDVIDRASRRQPQAWQNEAGACEPPNATILGVPEGVIIETGKPYTFQGYVDAFDHKVKSIEFSMDHGETWTTYDLGDTDVNVGSGGRSSWTPPEHGAYCLSCARNHCRGSEVSYREHDGHGECERRAAGARAD